MDSSSDRPACLGQEPAGAAQGFREAASNTTLCATLPSSSYGPSHPLCSKWCTCFWGPAGMDGGWLRAGKDSTEARALVTFPTAVSFAVPCQPGSLYSPAQQGREILPKGLGSTCKVTGRGRETESWCGAVPLLLYACSA